MSPVQNFFHLHLISDATGETLIAAGRAVAAQYAHARAIEHVYPMVRTEKQLNAALTEIDQQPGIVLYTIVDRKLAGEINARCAAMGLPCVSVLDPIQAVFQSYLGAPSERRVGAQHMLTPEYFHRIEALNFTMEHDDGALPADIEQADVIIVGISRTSKTPTAIYLANRGVKTVNVPLLPNVGIPPALVAAKRPLIVGLIATAERISHIRQNRPLGSVSGYDPSDYANRISIAEELAYAKKICQKHGWPMIDVSRRSIEETAAAIMALRKQQK